MKLASLFDGSGGFPLAGMQCGMTPIWASEVEPYPIRVTRDRIPGMKHLGSVTEIKGSQVEIPDVLTFGSPCQDLSVAGKQKGIHDGERSSLFFQAIRIIKEMRAHDRAIGRANEHVRPRFSVWENVPGAYSSNGGRDFQAVLQALCEIADPAVSIPFPQKGKWANAGCIVGDGYSIAWRTYDAQYWHGTPQRRKRIYLIADFASERAGEILFEQESVPRDIEPGEKEGQGTAENPAGGLAGSDCNGVITSAGFVGRQGAKSGSVGYEEEKSPTLRQGITTDCVYAIEGNVIDRNSTQNGKGWSEDKAPTLNATDRHGVCMAMNVGFFITAVGRSPTLLARMYKDPHVAVYDCRGNGDGKMVPTLTGDHENRVIDYTALCIGNGQLNQMSMGDKSNTLDCMHDKQAVMIRSDKPPRKWIVRRLTPLECCRLQGFPDGWGDVLEIADLTDDDYDFWLSVRNTHAAINGKKQGKYTKEQMIRWLNALHTDSAEYKMWGNGIALPCVRDVMRRIAKTEQWVGNNE
jgi:DNA (cytosine-5)-methyltransferase 1